MKIASLHISEIPEIRVDAETVQEDDGTGPRIGAAPYYDAAAVRGRDADENACAIGGGAHANHCTRAPQIRQIQRRSHLLRTAHPPRELDSEPGYTAGVIHPDGIALLRRA